VVYIENFSTGRGCRLLLISEPWLARCRVKDGIKVIEEWEKEQVFARGNLKGAVNHWSRIGSNDEKKINADDGYV
jgi:hypothetical protein